MKGICLSGLYAFIWVASFSFVPTVSADAPTAVDWTGEAPPPGWSSDAYSPKSTSPNFGDEYEAPDDEAYNSFTDPHHPLKNPDKDPGKDWDRKNRQNMPDNSPGVSTGGGDWPWGEKYYDSEFDATLQITNKCETPQPVKIIVNKLPWLNAPPDVVVAPGVTTLTFKVKLPPEPPPPLLTGAPGESWGHVTFPPFVVPPSQPPPKLHQPNFLKIEGTLVTWHPWTPAGGKDCNPARNTFTASGHIHFKPPSPKSDGGPQKLATPDVCEVYWKIGKPPAQLDLQDQDCTEKIRELALRFRDVILQPYVVNAPEEWMWLPGADQIAQMSIDQLLAMKAHAEVLLGHRPEGDVGGVVGTARPVAPSTNASRSSRPLNISGKAGAGAGISKSGITGDSGVKGSGQQIQRSIDKGPGNFQIAPSDGSAPSAGSQRSMQDKGPGQILKKSIDSGPAQFRVTPQEGGAGATPQIKEGASDQILKKSIDKGPGEFRVAPPSGGGTPGIERQTIEKITR